MQVYIESNHGLFDTAAARADIRLLALCLIMGVTSWTGRARLLPGESLKLRTLDYVEAARASGVSHARIISRHIFPNVFHLVLIAIVLDFSGLVLAEAVLETTLPYPHHRSLFFGCDKVNGANYWQEGNERGQIVSRGPVILTNGTGW